MAQACFHKRALRAAVEIASKIAKIFDHLKSLDEIIPITFLTDSVTLAIRSHFVFFRSLDKSENEISQATRHLTFFF